MTTDAFAGRAGPACDIIGAGADLVMLPAPSSVSTRDELHPLARGLADRFRCIVPDWPGFGDRDRPRSRPTPEVFHRHLHEVFEHEVHGAATLLACGHAAAYALTFAAAGPERIDKLVLVAPTWRGPLPTAMGAHRQALWRRVRRLIELPVLGPLVYRLNVSRPVVRHMLREHVYAEAAFVTPERVDAKTAVTRRRRARFATAAFVSGGLDAVGERTAFLDLLARAPKPILLVRGDATPRKSAAEMAAMIDTPGVEDVTVEGALGAFEESAGDVASAVRRFLGA